MPPAAGTPPPRRLALRRRTLARALVSLTLLAFAYLLGVAAALLLIWLGTISWGTEGVSSWPMGLYPIGLGLMILWSLRPRPVRLEPPGKKLERDDQPELFAIVEDIAQRARQQMPDDIYL